MAEQHGVQHPFLLRQHSFVHRKTSPSVIPRTAAQAHFKHFTAHLYTPSLPHSNSAMRDSSTKLKFRMGKLIERITASSNLCDGFVLRHHDVSVPRTPPAILSCKDISAYPQRRRAVGKEVWSANVCTYPNNCQQLTDWLRYKTSAWVPREFWA